MAGAAGYELQLWNGSAWDPLVSGLTGTTYTHGNLAAGWTYFYQVRALDANGAGGAWSQWVQATTPMGLAAPALTATPSGADTVELGWNAVANAAGYELQLWTGSAWIPLVSGLTGTTYTHRNLAAGRTYYYRIRALDANAKAAYGRSGCKRPCLRPQRAEKARPRSRCNAMRRAPESTHSIRCRGVPGLSEIGAGRRMPGQCSRRRRQNSDGPLRDSRGKDTALCPHGKVRFGLTISCLCPIWDLR